MDRTIKSLNFIILFFKSKRSTISNTLKNKSFKNGLYICMYSHETGTCKSMETIAYWTLHLSLQTYSLHYDIEFAGTLRCAKLHVPALSRPSIRIRYSFTPKFCHQFKILDLIPISVVLYLSHHMGKPTICIGENKGADQLRGVTAKLINAFVFATRIVQFLFYLNPKFQASSSFLCLYRSVCVGSVRKPHCWFSHEAAHLFPH